MIVISTPSIEHRLQEDPAVFRARFWRCHRLLHFIACRVLGGSEWADDAVENCWLTASLSSPRFECEGEFRRWLLRVLIDEALTIREDRDSCRACEQRIDTSASK